MQKSFQKNYAVYYDAFTKDKDYEAECDFVESIFKKFSKRKPKKILDLGCGTGGHAIPLAKRGYKIVGVDGSEEMIRLAQQKVKKARVDVDFYTQDMRTLKLDKKFDAAISMFAVMDYLLTYEDLRKALLSIKKHLRRSSLFIFDFWNGLAVLNTRPENRVKTATYGGKKIIRFVTPRLDSMHHTCENTFYCLVKENSRILDEFTEKHMVRFYFPEEITHYLEENGFRVLGLFVFMDLHGKPDEKTWNLTAVTQVK